MVVLAHGGDFAVYLFPVGAAVFLLWLLKKEAPKDDTTTPTVLPKSPLSRQVFAATRPKKRLHTTAPKGGGFRPPSARDSHQAAGSSGPAGGLRPGRWRPTASRAARAS